MAPTSPATQGDLSNHKNLLIEPVDHALQRSRGGLSTKIHALVDGNRRSLVLLLGPGQAGDAPMFENLVNAIRVEKLGPGAARTRPMRAMADKAYSSKAIRKYLRDRGIQCVIPERMIRKPTASAKGQLVGGQCPTIRRRIGVVMSWSAASIP